MRKWILITPFVVHCLAAQSGLISGPLVVSEKWPECTSLETWTQDVMRLERLEHASETAQAKAFFVWLRLFSRMATGGMIQAYEGDDGQEKYVTDAHKNLFVYGWGYCDTTSRIAEAAWTEFKHDPKSAERVVLQHDDGGYHTLYRLRLDGHYGAFDPRYGYYVVDRDAPDARILDWEEVHANLLKNRGYRYRSTPFFEYFGVEWERAQLIKPAYYPSEQAWTDAGSPRETVFGNRQYVPGTRFHSMDFQLLPGMTIERHWDNGGRKFYVPTGKHTQQEEKFLPSGRFYRVTETMLDGNWVKYDPNYQRAKPYLSSVPRDEGYDRDVSGGRTIGQAWGKITYKPDAAALAKGLINIYSPYVLVDGIVDADVEIRTLRGKAQNEDEPDHWSEWTPARAGALKQVRGVYQFQVRGAGGKLKPLKLELSFENGIMSIPQIFAGTNQIHFKVRDASAIVHPVRIAYRYQTAGGEQTAAHTLAPADFHGNTASYEINAPGLTRCDSLTIAY
ncbi:MAG: hypothetical protein U0Q18_15620 [Bryobacteraceae bacterium]